MSKIRNSNYIISQSIFKFKKTKTTFSLANKNKVTKLNADAMDLVSMFLSLLIQKWSVYMAFSPSQPTVTFFASLGTTKKEELH